MKLHILSDVHIEFGDFDPPEIDVDVVILAGDTHLGDQGVAWAAEKFKDKLVIYVIGNHEYYHGTTPEVTDKIRARAAGTNVHLLENDELIIGNVRFLGCTLWTDFQLLNNLEQSLFKAQTRMNDFRLIHLTGFDRTLEPLDTEKWHHASKKWLQGKLTPSSHDTLKNVVITHHAPSARSVPKIYQADELSPAFASDMEGFISDLPIDLWIHGHIHDSFDYHIGDTRVICNPRGYLAHELNDGFIADLTVEI